MGKFLFPAPTAGRVRTSTHAVCILQAGSMRSFAFSTRAVAALHQVRQQGCPSRPALSSPEGGSRQVIADIPRFVAPPGDAHRARGSLIFAPPQHAGCNTSASFLPPNSRSPRNVQPFRAATHRLQRLRLRVRADYPNRTSASPAPAKENQCTKIRSS